MLGLHPQDLIRESVVNGDRAPLGQYCLHMPWCSKLAPFPNSCVSAAADSIASHRTKQLDKRLAEGERGKTFCGKALCCESAPVVHLTVNREQ